MRRWHLMALGLTLIWAASAAAQAPEAKPGLGDNAALKYWQAFAQMPTLDKDQEKLLGEWSKVPLDAAALKLIDESQNSLMNLHRAAKLERCDWGLDYNDGISLLLPHLAKSRDLARLAALHARHELEQGRWKTAREDAAAMMALARHVGRDPIMICMLVRFLIEETVIDLMAPYVTELKAPHTQVAAMYEALPKTVTLQQAILAEKQFMAGWIIKKIKDEEQRKKGAGVELWKKLLEGPDIPDSLKKVDSADEAVRLMENLLPFYDEIAKFVAMPRDEFEAQYPEFKKKTKAAQPLAGVLLPAIDQIRDKDNRLQARLAMLLAAVAVARDGPDKLKDFKDPFGKGPFEHKALDKGFELKSKLLYDGKPVTLTVGQRQKD